MAKNILIEAINEMYDKNYSSLDEVKNDFREEEILDSYLRYEGIIGYTEQILSVMEQLRPTKKNESSLEKFFLDEAKYRMIEYNGIDVSKKEAEYLANELLNHETSILDCDKMDEILEEAHEEFQNRMDATIRFYIECYDRELLVYVSKEDEEKAKEILERAYDTWTDYEQDEVIGQCCEEYLLSRLDKNCISYVEETNEIVKYEMKIYDIAKSDKDFIEKIQDFIVLVDDMANEGHEPEIGFIWQDYFIHNPWVDTNSYTPVDPVEQYGEENFTYFCNKVKEKMEDIVQKYDNAITNEVYQEENDEMEL